MRFACTVLLLALALLMPASRLVAAKGAVKKGPPNPAAQRVNAMLKGVLLTDEQKAQLAQLENDLGPKLTEATQNADVLAPEQKEAIAQASKAAKAAGKKGKEIGEALQSAAAMTNEQKTRQAEARKQLSALEKELRERVLAVLSPEQMEQLKLGGGKKKPGKR